jgi:hypothetical protein
VSELTTEGPQEPAIPRCCYVVAPRVDGKVDRSNPSAIVICGKPASHLYGSNPICVDHVLAVQEKESLADPPTPHPPYVGMPATVCYMSDRYPATVVYVSKSLGKVIVYENDAKRTDANGMSDSQEWEIGPMNGTEHVFFRNSRGGYGGRGKRLVLGVQECFHDFSF